MGLLGYISHSRSLANPNKVAIGLIEVHVFYEATYFMRITAGGGYKVTNFRNLEPYFNFFQFKTF